MLVDGKQVSGDWAWARYVPDRDRPWNLLQAGHLYRRAGFGGSWEQLQQAVKDGPQETIDKLLRPEGDVEGFNRTYDDFEKALAGSEKADGLRAWWLRRMINTPFALLEKMTLFWHGHFAVSNVKVKSAGSMQRYCGLMRANALGSFRDLLAGICNDSAVLLSLDCAENRKANPNEKLARTLLGAFTVGEGGYTDDDVTGAARAFTGNFVRRGKLKFIGREHDDKDKKILGQTGNFGGDDVVGIVLGREATSRRIVRKLYGWLISETERIEDEIIEPLVEGFAADYDILKVVETILKSNLFFSSAAYRCRVKSPVEFAVGIVRGLEGMVSTSELANDLAGLGQNLYYPATINGWAGGRYWINDATLIGRSNLAAKMLLGSKAYGKKLDAGKVAGKYGHATEKSACKFLVDLFLQGDVESGVCGRIVKAASGQDDAMRRIGYSVVTLPEFHLA